MDLEVAMAVPGDAAEWEATAKRAKGDRAAFAAVYVAHRDSVFRYLRARCRNDDDALELAAVTFERALAAIPRYESRGGGIVAWLLRIARNAVIDYERKRRPLLPYSVAASVAADDPSPEDLAVGADDRRVLRSLLAELPVIQRDAIALRYGAGLTAREIGLVVNKSESATQKLISRALARLKEGMS